MSSDSIIPVIFSRHILDTVQSENYPLPLTVVGRSFPLSDRTGSGPANEIKLSADGRSFSTAWHRGPESDDSTYVEIIRTDGPSFHGWVDAKSRQIVQAG